MGQLFNTTAKTNTQSLAEQSQVMSWAADDVVRIARRTPSLFRTKSVPQIHTRRIDTYGETT